jgi:hypothetical protein
MSMADSDEQRYSAGIRLIGLALSLHRDSAHAAGTNPGGEMPQGMEFLLRVANGNDEPLALAMRETGAHKAELKQAAIRFIEQVSFGPGDDPYRVLGLNPLAPPVEVKQHYGLLIRLFHPDRGIADHAAAGKCSARINQAYTAIRKQSPAQFTGSGVQHGPSAGAASTTARRPSTHSAPVRFGVLPASPLRLDSLPIRLTPQRVWGAIAVSAALFVAAVYLANQKSIPGPADTPTMASSRTAPAETPAAKSGNVAAGNKLDRLLAGLAQPVAAAPPPLQPAASAGQQPAGELPVQQGNAAAPQQQTQAAPRLPIVVQPAMNPAPLTPTPNKVSRGAAMTPLPLAVDPLLRNSRPDALKKASIAVADDNATDLAAGSAQQALTAEKVPAAAVSAASAGSLLPAAVAIEQPEPTEDELYRVVAQFIGSYNQGDLESFMTLIDDNIRTDEPGGKEGLRQAYGRLFSNSAAREMLLKNLHWQRDGKLAVGLTDYHVTVSRPGETTSKFYTGSLRIEVAKLDGRPLISGFYNRPDRK